MTTRNTLAESAQILARGKFTTGGSVTITVYRNAGGTAEALDSAACTEQDSSGHYLWPFSNLTNAPSTYSDYLWIMTNGTPAEDRDGTERFAGWPENVSSLQGANTVTITIKDNQAIPVVVEGVAVQIYNSDNTLFLDSKITDENGLAVFLLDNGSYKVRLSKVQNGFTIPEDLVVSGTTVDEYIATPNTIISGAGAGECEVSIFTSSQRPTIALADLIGTAKIESLPAEISGVYYPGKKVNGTYDSGNKRMFWILPQLATVQFVVDNLGIGGADGLKAIPATSSADYKNL